MRRRCLTSTAVAFVALATSLCCRSAGAQTPPTTAPTRTERVCYMGIMTSPATAALRAQLGLPKGVGVVVEQIDPSSPANDAGLQQFDLIHKFNDQTIVNVSQLTALVRLQKKNDDVKVSVIRRGQPTELSLKLCERDVPVVDDTQAQGAGVMPAGHGVRISGLLQHFDGTNRYDLITRGEDRQIVIKDKSNQTLYTGPLNSAEDRAQVPEAYRAVVERVEQIAERMKTIRPNSAEPTTRPAA